MSTTVQYKGNTLTTVSNATKTLKTAGKYMEGDVSIIDNSGSGQGNVWQDAEGYLHLDDESGISLQTKSATPSETAQTITADEGYYALDKVNIGAISSSYVGSGITRRSSTDLTNSLPSGVYRFIVPAGYYAEQATKDIAKYDLPTPTISIDNSTGVITATSFLGNAGYINIGTKTATEQLTLRDSDDLTVSGATVTIPAGYYSAQTSKSVASGTAGTPTVIKGTVSNHSVNITPSVTNSAGYIAGGTKNGTAVSVSASELVSGTKAITENGTDIDVTNYASVDVAVPSSEPNLISLTVTPSSSQQVFTGQYVVKNLGTLSGSNSSTSSSQLTITTSIDLSEIEYGKTYHIVADYISVHNGSQYSNIIAIDTDWVASENGSVPFTYTSHIGSWDITSITLSKTQIKINVSSNYDGLAFSMKSWNPEVSHEFIVYGIADGYNPVTVEAASSSSDNLKNFLEREYGSTIILPSNLTKIGDYACYNYENLALTSLPNTITHIGRSAFYGCTNLALTSLPSDLTSFGTYAFYKCTNLALTSLPSGVTSIGASVFYNCAKLALTSLPNGLARIDASAFYGCTNLALTSLPSSVTYIGDRAFYNCAKLALTSLPNGVTTIGTNAFYQCTNLVLTSLPSDLTSLGTYAFYGCKNIALTSIPSGVTTIGTYTFYGCTAIEEIDAKGDVSSIASSAFERCTNLKTLILRKTDSICTLGGSSAFSNTPIRGYNSQRGTIYVPSALISSYQTANNWNTIYDAGTVDFVAIEGSKYEE